MRIALATLTDLRGYGVVVGLVIAAFTINVAWSQSLSPMRGEVSSNVDLFAVKVFPGNPYKRRTRIDVRVYDTSFKPVKARVIPPWRTIAAGDKSSFTVVVPFEGRSRRRVRICAESVPFPNETTKLRTQVCGRFLGKRLR